MKKELIKVVFLGYQERVDGISFMQVNEVEGHSTVKYDKGKHILVDKQKKRGDWIMSKKGQKRIEAVERQLILYAKQLAERKPGGVNYRISLSNLERLIFIRKGLLDLREMGDL